MVYNIIMKTITLHIKIDPTKECREERKNRARVEMETGVVLHKIERNRKKYNRKDNKRIDF